MNALPLATQIGSARSLPLPPHGSRLQKDRSILYEADITLGSDSPPKSFLTRLALRSGSIEQETLEGRLYFDQVHYQYLERQDLNFLEVHVLVGPGLNLGASCPKEGHNCLVERTSACFKAYMVVEFGQTPHRAEHHQSYYTAALHIHRDACLRLKSFTAGIYERMEEQSDALVNVLSLDDKVLAKRFQEIFEQRIGTEWDIDVKSVQHAFRGVSALEPSRSITIMSRQSNRSRGFWVGMGLADGRAFNQPVSADNLEKEVLANLMHSSGNTQMIKHALFQLREIRLIISNDLSLKHVEYAVDRSANHFITAGQVARLILLLIPAVGQSFAIAAKFS